ncbi:MAG: hypothetical protein IPP34_14505 [Bacteroidetes bacterium]|nr:hypothetical protein [Bacteroidota bacterium]
MLKFGTTVGFALPVLGLVWGSTPQITSDSLFSDIYNAAGIAMPDTGRKDSTQLPYPWMTI